MTFLEDLNNDSNWDTFLEMKIEDGYLPDRILEDLAKFITNRRYKDITIGLEQGEYTFSDPRRKAVNKAGTDRKRIVYSFRRRENMVLKMVAFLLHRYDHILSPNLYSFRTDVSVKAAVHSISSKASSGRCWCYKADVHDYFNSVDTDILLPELEHDLDPDTYGLIEGILRNPRVVTDAGVKEEYSKGIMAGIPFSAFLANYYLKDLDWRFHDEGVLYARYADDIVVFADSEEELLKHRDTIIGYLKERHLEVNPRKEHFYKPGDSIEFLGFSFRKGEVDIGDGNIMKMKQRIRRASRSIRRWMLRKGVDEDASLRVMVRKFNTKFYGWEEGEIAWARWYFSVINTDVGLHTIDRYMQDNLRYLVTGRYCKKNYEKVPYKRLKDAGYLPLVSAYYDQVNAEHSDQIMDGSC